MTDLSAAGLTGQALETLRLSIARLLPLAMEQAVASYREFVVVEVPLEAKEFKDHHTAGRTALVHLETLLRLARWAALPAGAGEEPAAEEEIDTMVSEARQALAALRAGSGSGDAEMRDA